MKKIVVLTVISFAQQVFANDDEYMEVSAPNECCASLPSGLGALTGWVGASGSSGAATLKAAALKYAVDKVAKEKSKKDEKKEEEKSEYDKATDSKSNNDSLYREMGLTLRQLLDNGGRKKVKNTHTNPDGSKETLEVEDCVPSGPLNPNKLTCTEEKFELFTDPTDGVERWAFTMSVVVGVYNPKHYDANAKGWYPKVVDNQTFTVVFDTETDLIWQMQKVTGK